MKMESIEEKKKRMYEQFNSVHEEVQNAIEDYITQGYIQTLAKLLVYLDESRTADILKKLPAPVQKEVKERYDRFSLKNKQNALVTSEVKYVLDKVGYTEKSLCNQVIQGMDSETLHLLSLDTEELAKTAPIIASGIETYLFEFKDLLNLDNRTIQKVLREVDQQTLALALKNEDAELQNKIFQVMSKKAAQMLKEDIEFLGPVHLKSVEEAHREIIQVVYRLDANGDIIIFKKADGRDRQNG